MHRPDNTVPNIEKKNLTNAGLTAGSVISFKKNASSPSVPGPNDSLDPTKTGLAVLLSSRDEFHYDGYIIIVATIWYLRQVFRQLLAPLALKSEVR